MPAKKEHKTIKGIEHKHCFRCDLWQPINCFCKNKNIWDNLQNQCKTCVKQYYQANSEQIAKKTKQYHKDNYEQIAEYQKQYRKDNCEQIAEKAKQYYKDNREQKLEQKKQYYQDNREQIIKQGKQYYQTNREQITERNKQYYQNNSKQIAEQKKQYLQSPALYDTYAHQIRFCEETRRTPDNSEALQIKCAYCGKWVQPTNLQVKNRLLAFNGNTHGEHRFYCSEYCKRVCPIYKQHKYPKGFKQATSREVVPLLRQLVLKRDNYTCQKCGATTETAQLHVHHIIPYTQNKMQANDPDSCITFCKSCHKEAHQQDGCKTSDLKCGNN